MNQNENPMFPWDSSILPTAVPPFRETVTDSFLWCRRKEEAVQRTQPPLFYLFRFSFCLFLNLISAILHYQLTEHCVCPGEPLSGVNGRIIYENTLVHQSCTAVGCHQFVDHLMFLLFCRFYSDSFLINSIICFCRRFVNCTIRQRQQKGHRCADDPFAISFISRPDAF
mgnify:CR=1 FL=1